jgi:hypothetical protein
METFIRTWKNFLPKSTCDDIIDRFEIHANNKELSRLVYDNKWNNSMARKDQAIFLQSPEYNEHELVKMIGAAIDSCAIQYGEEFGHIKSQYLTHRNCIKIQKTLPYGGYHVWHHEQCADGDSHDRELVWTVYLNDMPQGEAETEFMYQHVKVQPTVGTICIFPAAMTHLHRGLTVYTYPKYIATGWYYIKD